MIKKILLYFALLLWFVVPVSAQLTFLIPTQVVENGQSIQVDIKALDFQNILSMQFSVNWNPNTLQFDSVSTPGAIPDYADANFGTTGSSEGKLTTAWFDQDLSGVSLDDSTTIFTIVFNVIGSPDSNSIIAITGDPTMIEVSNTDGDILAVTTENGMIIVDNPLSIDPFNAVQANEQFTLFQNEPNPFSTQTRIRFDLNRSNEVKFLIFDIKGQLIYTFKEFFLEGNHTVTIDRNKLPWSGTYFFTMQTNEYSLTNKMILIR